MATHPAFAAGAYARTRASERVFENLTDRQQSALEAALCSGLFEWPREDVAASLGIAPATSHQHLRTAQRQVFESLLSDPALTAG